jgi:hypothetical protein
MAHILWFTAKTENIFVTLIQSKLLTAVNGLNK